MYQNQIIEIDFKEWLWSLLSQWKAIVVVSVIIALLICGIRYHNDLQLYNNYLASKAEAAKQAEIAPEERVEQLLLSLPEEDREKVVFIVHEKQWLNDQKKYIQESVLMDTNPANQKVLKIVYNLSSEDESDLPVLLHNYSVFSQGEDVCERIKQYIAINSDNKYISELFYKDDHDIEIIGNGTALCINVVLPEDSDAESITKAIDDAFSQYSKSLQSQYPHNITFAESEVMHIYHKRNVEEKTKVISSINNMEASIKASEGELTARQSEVLNGIMSIIDATNEADTEINAEGEADTVAKPGLSKKHAILGFVLGAFFYAMMYLIIIVLKCNVFSAASLARFTQSRLLGEIYFLKENTIYSKLFNSRMINKFHYRDKLDTKKQICKTTDSIDAVYKHSQAKALALLCLIKSDEGTRERDIINQIIEQGNSFGDEIILYDMFNDIDEKQLLSLENAVVIAKNTTKYGSIRNLNNLCKEYGVNVLGHIYITDI